MPVATFISVLFFFLFISYALPTKSTEVMLMQEQGTKMYVDAILKTHERVVQVRPSSVCWMSRLVSPLLMFFFVVFFYLFLQLSSLDAALCPIFVNAVLKNQPEGVKLAVKEVSS